MKLPYDDVHLIADPLYGYLRITLSRAGEIAEADVIDSPWVQRLKRIHQLQSSWWVFPTAEHSRFAHSLGAMHLAGQLARQVHATLAEVEPGTPSLPLVEETLRLAGLLQATPAAQLTDAEREAVRRAAQQAVGEIRAGAQIRGLDQLEADDIEG